MNIGDTYTLTYRVTEKIYRGFAEIFSDYNPLHTDKDFAVGHGMPDVVMYGNILNGFLSHFVGEGLPQKNVIIHAQTIRFYLPVFLNDELELTAEVAEVYESVKTVVFKFIFKNAAGKRVANGTVQTGII